VSAGVCDIFFELELVGGYNAGSTVIRWPLLCALQAGPRKSWSSAESRKMDVNDVLDDMRIGISKI
jgi:hypothetical protein